MSKPKNRLTRRDFLAASAAAGAGAALAGALGTTGCGPAGSKMPTMKLGRTGETVPILGFGSSLNVTPQLLNTALTEGITFIDTAQSYSKGNSEKNIGAILEKNGRRKDCLIVTKSGKHDVKSFADRLAGSLESLRTDHVDLYYLHNLGDPDRLDDELKTTAEKLKKEKKIRFFGFSSHHENMVETLERAAEVGFVDVIMFKYNFRTYEDAALNRAMDKCATAGIGLVAMKTQGGAVDSFQDRVDGFEGKGFNKHQAALKAVWADNRVHTIVSAMKNVRQVKENAEASRQKQIVAAERELLDRYAAETDHLYCRGCAQN